MKKAKTRTTEDKAVKTRRKAVVRWNFRRLIMLAGGDAQCSRMLTIHKLPPAQPKTIQAWKRRDKIPADRIAVLFALMDRMGIPVSINDFIEVTYVDR